MPQFTGNLKDIGLDPRPGLHCIVKCTAVRLGVGIDGHGYAGSKTFDVADNGDVTLNLASTVGLVPNTMVKLTGEWLGDDDHFELPAFQVPEVSGTLFDLVSLSGVPAFGLYGRGFGPPPDYFNGFAWFDISGDTVRMYPREF